MKGPRRALGRHLPLCLVGLIAVGCVSTTTLGTGGSLASGAAGAGASGTLALERCDAPLGAIALVEDEANAQLLVEASDDLQIPRSPVPLLRLLLQQSNCFQVVDRAGGLRGVETEQSLARDQLLKEGSNVTTGQLVAADYSLTPHVVFAEDDAGGLTLGGALVDTLGSLLGGGVNVERSEAQVVMFLTDNRSGVQIAAAEGSARVSDWDFLGFGAGDRGAGGGYGWGSSNTGKVVAAALVDGLNKIVQIVRSDTP